MPRKMKILLKITVATALVGLTAAGLLFAYPRPADTSEARVFAADGALVDYCDLPELDGQGLLAADIPKAFTPGCGWERWPMPILANCREPLAENVDDLRGLWRSVNADIDHVERIEQCGNRTVVTSAGIIHDFFSDGTLANGARDIQPRSCMNIWAAIEWDNRVMTFRPLGLPFVAVTRERQGEQLVWNYPTLGEVRMERICEIPAADRRRVR